MAEGTLVLPLVYVYATCKILGFLYRELLKPVIRPTLKRLGKKLRDQFLPEPKIKRQAKAIPKQKSAKQRPRTKSSVK